MNRRDETILDKMLGYCAEVEAAHQYFRDDMTLFLNPADGAIYRNAVSMPILQIGELAKNLSEEYRAENKAIPWRYIIRTRDLFAHHYGAVDYEQLWDTSHGDIADLRAWLTRAKQG
ncbi:MAG: DUF86 domain-containing protein [Oscillospiraceae bacterium]|nr:DUF86 domain-containing protein [Oscillospiraceae bacterium]